MEQVNFFPLIHRLPHLVFWLTVQSPLVLALSLVLCPLFASLSGNKLDRAGNEELVATPTPWVQSTAFLGQSLPMVYGVPESVKKKTWLGYNVPLYMFLPGYTDPGTTTQLVPT